MKPALNRTALGLPFIFGIDRCLVYTGKINKDFLHWDFGFIEVLLY
jgi:hypothetical protein